MKVLAAQIILVIFFTNTKMAVFKLSYIHKAWETKVELRSVSTVAIQWSKEDDGTMHTEGNA